MEPSNDSTFEFLRHSAGIDLTIHQQSEMQRLVKVLRYGSQFQTIFVEIADPVLRESLISRLDEVLTGGKKSFKVDLSDLIWQDVGEFKAMLLKKNMEGVGIIHLVNGDVWFNDDRLHWLNIQREALAHALKCRLVFWLPASSLDQIALQAADLWSWRSGVYDLSDLSFSNDAPSFISEQYAGDSTADKNFGERVQRIAVLREWLSRVEDEELRRPLLEELADLLLDMGDANSSLKIRRENLLPIYEEAKNEYMVAFTWQKIADILELKGELDQALEIRQKKVLEIYQGLHNERACAIVFGQIADILQARGELDETLKIRFEKELPVYEKIGDEKSRVVTLGQIADIFEKRGNLNEALRVRRDEILPVYEKNGDIRAKSITLGKIANILEVRGELNEALRIRRDEELPVYEKLGDVRSRIVTVGEIADILETQGDVIEALRMRREEVLPVYEKLGDVRGRAIVLGKIAGTYRSLGKFDEALHILEREALPVFEKLNDPTLLASGYGEIAMILKGLGRKDDALRILKENVLPLYEKVGAIRSRALELSKVAEILYERGDFDEVIRIHEQEILPVCEQTEDFLSYITASLNLATCLIKCGRPEDIQKARIIVGKVREISKKFELKNTAPSLLKIQKILDEMVPP